MEENMLNDKNMDLSKRVIETVDIIETIQKYLPLEKSSSGFFEGKCPFNEKCGKSLIVSPAGKSWYCFGCHARGDVVTFVSKIGTMNRTTAARFLDNLQKSKSWSNNEAVSKEETKE